MDMLTILLKGLSTTACHLRGRGLNLPRDLLCHRSVVPTFPLLVPLHDKQVAVKGGGDVVHTHTNDVLHGLLGLCGLLGILRVRLEQVGEIVSAHLHADAVTM